MLGGSDPAIPNLVSENVIVRHNYMSKPMAWRDPVIPAPAAVAGAGLPAAGSLPAGIVPLPRRRARARSAAGPSDARPPRPRPAPTSRRPARSR